MATLLPLHSRSLADPPDAPGAPVATMVRRLAGLWHLTSLDAPTVAVVWTLAFAWAARIHLPPWLPAVLALAAWCFYVGDRLLDARNARTPLRDRHHFHWHNRRIFLPAAIFAALTGLALVIHSMTPAARERNSVLAAAALAYFTSVHSPWRPSHLRVRVPKELLVGVLFTLACAAPAWSRTSAGRADLLPAILLFIALAWLNCHAIERWESQAESPLRPVREHSIRLLGSWLAGAGFLSAAIEAARHNSRFAALLAAAAISAALLAALDLAAQDRRSLSPLALRAAADLVLLTPLALLVLPRGTA